MLHILEMSWKINCAYRTNIIIIHNSVRPRAIKLLILQTINNYVWWMSKYGQTLNKTTPLRHLLNNAKLITHYTCFMS